MDISVYNDKTPDPRPGQYYVTARREDGRFAMLVGPLESHRAALDLVRVASELVIDEDRSGIWYSYGTARLPEDFQNAPKGKLNDMLGVRV